MTELFATTLTSTANTALVEAQFYEIPEMMQFPENEDLHALIL